MSFLDDIFGAGAAIDDNNASYAESEAVRNAAARRGQQRLQNSNSRQGELFRNGNARALSALSQGYSTARRDIDAGVDAQRTDLNAGYDAAIAAENDFLDRTSGIYQPYIDDGNAAGELYQNALGVNGADAQGQFYDTFQNDPYFEYNQQQALRALDQANNATGVSGGRAALAGQRVSQEMGSAALSERLNRLSGLYDMAVQSSDRVGQQTAATGQRVAGYEAGRGQQLAGTQAGRGSALANLATNYGMQRAGQQNLNTNNQAGRVANTTAQMNDLDYGNAQLSANNRVSLGNANAATRGTGMNNLINLAGTAARAYATGGMG